MRLKVSNVCQLFNKDNLDSFVVGNLDKITVTNNQDGTFIINGSYSNTYTSWYILNEWVVEKGNISQIVEGHKYLLLGDVEKVSGDIHLGINIWYVDGSSQSNYAGIITSLKTKKLRGVRVQYSIHEGDTADNAISKPQLFDLTEMYGAGNEPTTVAQFRQDFPNEMYEYSPVCWKKFRRLKYVTETKNLFDINKVVETVHVKRSGDGLICSSYGTSIGTLGTICPSLKVGDTVTVSFKTVSEGVKSNFIQTDNHILRNGEKFTVSETGLTSQFYIYNTSYEYRDIPNKTTYYELQLELGSTASPYQPYGYLPLNRGKYIANKEPVQLLDKSKFKAVTSKNVTATPDITNGMWTISGAATASEYLQIGVYYPGTDFNIGDKLFLRNSNIDNSVYFPYAAWYDKDNKYLGEKDGDGTFSVTNPETAYIACYFTTRTVGDINVTTQVQLFNLTRMYGKGNEPTAAEFVARYPGFDYSVNKYNAITFR